MAVMRTCHALACEVPPQQGIEKGVNAAALRADLEGRRAAQAAAETAARAAEAAARHTTGRSERLVEGLKQRRFGQIFAYLDQVRGPKGHCTWSLISHAHSSASHTNQSCAVSLTMSLWVT